MNKSVSSSAVIWLMIALILNWNHAAFAQSEDHSYIMMSDSPGAPMQKASSESTPRLVGGVEAASYPRISHLEHFLVGQTYANETPELRLKRLEIKAFGTFSTSKDLCARTDRLEDYAKYNGYSATIVDTNNSEIGGDFDSQSGAKPKVGMSTKKKIIIGGVIAAVLLGVVVMSGGLGAGAVGAVGAGGGMAAMAGAGAPMAAGMAGPSMMGGGMGLSGLTSVIPIGMQLLKFKKKPGQMGPPGFAEQPERVEKKKGRRPGEDSRQDERIEPIAMPDENTSLVDKVSWCEQQVFGKTFESMKMIDRVSQINDQLVPENEKERELKQSADSLLKTIRALNGNSAGPPEVNENIQPPEIGPPPLDEQK